FAQPAEAVQQQNPFAQPAEPVQQQNPFVQPAPIQQSTDPFAPVEPVQQSNPFVQPTPVQQSTDPFAQQTPVQQSEPFAQQAPAQQWGPMMKPEKSNKGSKTPLIIGLICGALTIVVILLVVILFACSGGGASSPEDAAKVYFEAISNKDFGDLKDVMYPPVFNEAYDEDVFEKDEFMNLISLSSYPDRYYLSDENAKITFSNVKVTDKENVSSSKVDSYNSSLKKQDGYITISKAAEIEGTVTIKVDGESKEYRFDATVVLAGGDWYIADIDID
ncbi:MAG: hypothetical protein K2M73_03820, partial [Lachnospiraceae bacterium]|nr:hypothetical protein [Lachnospiraceae bacterium]